MFYSTRLIEHCHKNLERPCDTIYVKIFNKVFFLKKKRKIYINIYTSIYNEEARMNRVVVNFEKVAQFLKFPIQQNSQRASLY